MDSTAKPRFGIIASCFLLAVAACTSQNPIKKVNPYDRLCVIFEDQLAGKQSPGPATFERLSVRLHVELPELDDNLGHLANLPKEDFYPVLKHVAESSTGEAWECSFIKQYYSGS